MHHLTVTLLTSILTLAGPGVTAEPPEVAPALTATLIANEGFLLEAGGRKVLVDALFGDYPLYLDTSPETRAAIIAGDEPFGNVDLVLTTHHHADHFDAEAVAHFLAANPKAIFVSTPQAVAQLEQEKGFKSFQARVRAVLPEEGKRVRMPELGLEVLNLHHGRDRKPPVQNLGFVIHLGSFKILHVGDTEASRDEFAANDLSKDAIDLAMMAYWHVLDDSWKSVAQVIQPHHVLAMHLEVKPEESNLTQLKKNRPGLLMPRKELETITLSAKPQEP